MSPYIGDFDPQTLLELPRPTLAALQAHTSKSLNTIEKVFEGLYKSGKIRGNSDLLKVLKEWLRLLKIQKSMRKIKANIGLDISSIVDGIISRETQEREERFEFLGEIMTLPFDEFRRLKPEEKPILTNSEWRSLNLVNELSTLSGDIDPNAKKIALNRLRREYPEIEQAMTEKRSK